MSAPEPDDLRGFLREQFARIDGQFARIDERFTRIDGHLAQHDQQFVAIGRHFLRHDERFDALERKGDDLRRELLAHFDQLYQRLDRLEVEYVAITQALRRLEGALVDERTRREALEERTRDLRAQIAALEVRLTQIEERLRD